MGKYRFAEVSKSLSLLSLALLFLAAVPESSEARKAPASMEEVASSNCARQLYTGFASSPSAESCNELFFFPTSAAVKCGLYLDAGYPSSLMRKACQLYDRGAIEFFLEDVSAEQ